MEKAFDAQRPAACLLEDSIRIFDGKNLRPLAGWFGPLLFASDPRYSLPLKEWQKKKRGRSAKGKAAKAAKQGAADNNTEVAASKIGVLKNNFTISPISDN